MCASTYTLFTTRNQDSSRPHLKMWMCNPVIYPDWAEHLHGANSELSRFSLLFLLALLGEKKAFQPPATNPRVNSYTPGTVADPVISAGMKWCVGCLLHAWFFSSQKSTHGRSSQMFPGRNRFLWFMVKGPCLFSLSGQQLKSQCFTMIKSQLIAPRQEQRAWSYNDLSGWNHKIYFHETEWE